MTIWKYSVTFGAGWSIRLPTNAKFLCVQVQHDEPQMWFEVYPTNTYIERTFSVFATGEPNVFGEYRGTFQLRGGHLVFHLYELL